MYNKNTSLLFYYIFSSQARRCYNFIFLVRIYFEKARRKKKKKKVEKKIVEHAACSFVDFLRAFKIKTGGFAPNFGDNQAHVAPENGALN